MAKSVTVYSYNELSDNVKEKALSDYVKHCLEYTQWEHFIKYDFKRIMSTLGFIVDDMSFSLFAQESRTCFTVSYSYECEWREKLTKLKHEMIMIDHEFWFNIGERLGKFEGQYGYSYCVIIEHNRQYYNEQATYLETYSLERYDKDGVLYIDTIDAPNEADEAFLDICRDIAQHLYKWTQEEYKYQTGEGAIKRLEGGKEYFFKDGRFYGYIP